MMNCSKNCLPPFYGDGTREGLVSENCLAGVKAGRREDLNEWGYNDLKIKIKKHKKNNKFKKHLKK